MAGEIFELPLWQIRQVWSSTARSSEFCSLGVMLRVARRAAIPGHRGVRPQGYLPRAGAWRGLDIPALVARVICGATRLGAVAWMPVVHPASGLVLFAAALAVSGVPTAPSALWLAPARCVKPIPVPVGDRAVAGQAKRAAGVVDHQEIRIVRVGVLHVRIVAAGALHISVDQPHGARLIGGGGRDWRSRTRPDRGEAFKGRVKLTGCMVERLVPNTSAEFICPLIGTFP